MSAKDAIVTALTGATSKVKDHAKAATELRRLSVRTVMPRPRRRRCEN